MRRARGPRSVLAERIATQLIDKAQRDGIISRSIRTPPVHVEFWDKPNVRGLCYWGSYLRLTLSRKSHPREWMVILAHEVAHWIADLGRNARGHGAGFQFVLWRVMPKGGILREAMAPGVGRRCKWLGHNLRYVP